MAPIPNENTSGRDEARRALSETRKSTTAATAIIESAATELRIIAEHRERNHFTDKFRAAIKGHA